MLDHRKLWSSGFTHKRVAYMSPDDLFGLGLERYLAKVGIDGLEDYLVRSEPVDVDTEEDIERWENDGGR